MALFWLLDFFVKFEWICKISKLNASEWASWVQAIGSVGAIAGAVLLFALQRRSERQDRIREALAEEHRLLDGARRLVHAGAHVCSKLARSLKDDTSPVDTRQLLTHASVSELQGVASALMKIDAIRFDDWQFTEAVLTSKSSIDYLVRVMEAGMQQGPMGFEARTKASECCEQTGLILCDRLIRLSKACVARGMKPTPLDPIE